MLLDWLSYGLAIWGLAALLNKTVFAEKQASKTAAWFLTVPLFFVNLAVMTAMKHFRGQAIAHIYSQDLGIQMAPKSPLDFVGAFTISWLFFSLLRGSRKTKVRVGAIAESKPNAASNSALAGVSNEAYAEALTEIEEGRVDKGVWAKAFAESAGDESKAKASYIKTRAELANKSWGTDAKALTQASAAVADTPSQSKDFDRQGNLGDPDLAATMAKLRVTCADGKFIFREYRYDKLSDALAYARKVQQNTSIATQVPVGHCREEPNPADPEVAALMETLGVTCAGGKYVFSEFRYDKLSDAFAYARKVCPGAAPTERR